MTVPLSGSGPPDASFLGRGLAWPLEVDHTGAIRLTGGTEGVERAMRVVLATAPGERVMRPEFGCRIWDLLFEPVNANLLGLMAEAVRDAFAQWEPRIAVDDVVVVPDADDHALVRIHVAYSVKTTNDKRNLVYPFYVIPHEES